MTDTPTPDQPEPEQAPVVDDASKQHLAVIDALGDPLDETRRTALIAALGNDLTPDRVKSTAKEWGWIVEPPTPTATPEQQQQAQQVVDGGNAATAEQAPPPPPVAPIQNVMQKAMTVSNPALLAPGSQLHSEALAAIQQTPGLVFGSAETIGGFEPL